jgi:hypothetical protein
MEMHALPYESVVNVIEKAGCDLLEVRSNDCLGIPNAMSFNFLVRKSIKSKVRAVRADLASRLARGRRGGLQASLRTKS